MCIYDIVLVELFVLALLKWIYYYYYYYEFV